jgi:hypothetical protein
MPARIPTITFFMVVASACPPSLPPEPVIGCGCRA